jgi:hypothetical protein
MFLLYLPLCLLIYNWLVLEFTGIFYNYGFILYIDVQSYNLLSHYSNLLSLLDLIPSLNKIS